MSSRIFHDDSLGISEKVSEDISLVCKLSYPSTGSCRVDPDNYLSEPPTDPDMRDYRIRLLELRIRYAATYRVDGNWWRKGVTL